MDEKLGIQLSEKRSEMKAYEEKMTNLRRSL